MALESTPNRYSSCDYVLAGKILRPADLDRNRTRECPGEAFRQALRGYLIPRSHNAGACYIATELLAVGGEGLPLNVHRRDRAL